MGSHPNLTKVFLLGNYGLIVSLKSGGRIGAKEMDHKEAFIFPYLTLQHWMFLNLTKNSWVSELFLCPMLTTNLLQICCADIRKYQVCFLFFFTFYLPELYSKEVVLRDRKSEAIFFWSDNLMWNKQVIANYKNRVCKKSLVWFGSCDFMALTDTALFIRELKQKSCSKSWALSPAPHETGHVGASLWPWHRGRSVRSLGLSSAANWV